MQSLMPTAAANLLKLISLQTFQTFPDKTLGIFALPCSCWIVLSSKKGVNRTPQVASWWDVLFNMAKGTSTTPQRIRVVRVRTIVLKATIKCC